MATAIVQIDLPGYTGLSLTLDLYPRGSDTAAVTGIALSESESRKCTYVGTTNAGLSGVYYALAREGATVRGSGYVTMTNTAVVHIVGEDVSGKVIGSSPGDIADVGARVVNEDGSSIQAAADATSNTVWSVELAQAIANAASTTAEISIAIGQPETASVSGDIANATAAARAAEAAAAASQAALEASGLVTLSPLLDELTAMITLAQDLTRADRYIDTSVSPFQLVLVKAGSGSLADGERLLEQNLYDRFGNGIASIDTFVAESRST